MPAADRFIGFADWLRGPVPPAAPAAVASDVPAPVPEPPPPPPLPPRSDAAEAEAARDVRLFRARLADALDRATRDLVRDLAYAVLGRELALAPADVAAIAKRLLAEHAAATPVTIRHALGEPVDVGLPAIADPALECGDVVLVLEGGELDARLGVRLDVILEAWA